MWRPRAWAWASLYVARLSRPTEAGSGRKAPARIRARAAFSFSPCHRRWPAAMKAVRGLMPLGKPLPAGGQEPSIRGRARPRGGANLSPNPPAARGGRAGGGAPGGGGGGGGGGGVGGASGGGGGGGGGGVVSSGPG